MTEDNNEAPVYNGKPSSVIMQIVYSFAAAFSGLFHVMLTQRNMRFHFSIGLWVISFAIALDLTGFQKAFLFIVITFVFSMEILNTCIEALTDLLSPEYNRLAKIAKDTAAAAVLSVSIGSVMSAGYLLIPPFFRNVPNPDWLALHAKEMIAIGTIVCSVLVYWFVRALKIFPRVFLFAGSAAGSAAIALLAMHARDGISFCALEFFSVLLFNSMARRQTSLYIAIAGHAAGAIGYLVIFFLF